MHAPHVTQNAFCRLSAQFSVDTCCATCVLDAGNMSGKFYSKEVRSLLDTKNMTGFVDTKSVRGLMDTVNVAGLVCTFYWDGIVC